MLNQDELPDLIDNLKQISYNFFEIETNGTIVPTKDMLESISWWNCSPKLSNNGMKIEKNKNPETLKTISDSGKADFKFVVSSPNDIDEIKNVYLSHIKPESIILMPEGATTVEQTMNSPWLLEECAKNNFRFSPRLHVLAWGTERKR